MNYFSRPYQSIAVAMLLGVGLVLLPPGAGAQTSGFAQVLEDPSPLLLSASPGYLGVLVQDVDSDSASKLKLKDARGAVVTLIDHDAPAAQAGICVNDVVLQLNGQPVDNSEQFGRMLHAIPAGSKVSLVISRDGNLQTIGVELVDHKKMEHDVWNKLGDSNDDFTPVPAMGMLAGSGDAPPSSGFHFLFFGSSLKVGALVEPLTSQMAEYLGVHGGLMVKQVTHKSEAAAAGFKAFDVILKVGPDGIATVSDWDRALRTNQGKPVPVTILRDRKQQTLTLQVDSKHHHAELRDLFPRGNSPLVAELDPELGPEFAQQFAVQVEAAADAMRQQTEAASFHLDLKQFEQLNQQMEVFRKGFNPGGLKLAPGQMEQLQRQMRQWKRQMEKVQGFRFGQFA